VLIPIVFILLPEVVALINTGLEMMVYFLDGRGMTSRILHHLTAP
jgi:hypothetical protein